jgi:hypothetical protein
MKRLKTPVIAVASGVVLMSGVPCQMAHAQSLLNQPGTSVLAPSVTPIGGFASNPQEYLSVAWLVTENGSGVYTYSYTVQNPAGDVLLTAGGGLTATPEIYDAFSADFDTTIPGAYVPASQTGGVFQQVNTVDLAWFFNPSVAAGTVGPTVTFESDLPPVLGNASAEGAIPWSSLSPGGQEIPIPSSVPEPTTLVLFTLAALLFFPFPRQRELAPVRVRRL